MKSLMSFVMLCFMAVVANAQIMVNGGVASSGSQQTNAVNLPKRSVGDVITVGEHRALVVSVVGTGEHGFALMLERYLTKEENAELKQEAKEARKADKEAKKKLTKEEKKALKEAQNKKAQADRDSIKTRYSHMNAVAAELTGSGLQNKKVIEEYCAKNNLDMAKVFPEHAYIKEKFGDDWYLPGDNELSVIAQYLLGGVGNDFNATAKKLKKEVVDRIKEQAGDEQIAVPCFNPNGSMFGGYQSSTWTIREKEKKDDVFCQVLPHCLLVMQLAPVTKFDSYKYYFDLLVKDYKMLFIKQELPLFYGVNCKTIPVYSF